MVGMPDVSVFLSVSDKSHAEQIIKDMEIIIKDYADILSEEYSDERRVLQAKVDYCYDEMMNQYNEDYDYLYDEFTKVSNTLSVFDRSIVDMIYNRRSELITTLHETHPHILI